MSAAARARGGRRGAARAAAASNALFIAALKRRRLAKPAACAISVIGSAVSSSSFFAKWTRRVCATASGDAPRCSSNRRRRWRSADADLRRELVHAALVERALADQAQRARHGGGRALPGRAARRRLRPAAPAGPEAGLRGRGRRRVEAAVPQQRRARGADGPAVDAGAGDAGEEAPVEAGVAAAQGAVADVGVGKHAASMPRPGLATSRFRTRWAPGRRPNPASRGGPRERASARRPEESPMTESVTYTTRTTSLGLLLVAATGRGVCQVRFGTSEAALAAALARELPCATLERGGARVGALGGRTRRGGGGPRRPRARAARRRRQPLPTPRVGRAAAHPARRDARLRRAGRSARPAASRTRRGAGVRRESGAARRAVPPASCRRPAAWAATASAAWRKRALLAAEAAPRSS